MQYIYLHDYGIHYAAYGYLFFLVKAEKDVHVTLSTIKGNLDSYETVIGGWSNAKSAIRLCQQCDPPVMETQHIPLNANFFQPFWVSWSGGDIRVGQGTELFKDEFLRLDDPNPKSINYVGISTGYGAAGTWIFSEGMLLWKNHIWKISALLALCEGNPPFIGGFSSQRSATRISDAFFDVFFWKHFLCYWPFVRRVHCPQWIPLTKASGALMFSLILPEQTPVIWDAVARFMTSLSLLNVTGVEVTSWTRCQSSSPVDLRSNESTWFQMLCETLRRQKNRISRLLFIPSRIEDNGCYRSISVKISCLFDALSLGPLQLTWINFNPKLDK